MKKTKQKNKYCIKCGKPATIYGGRNPTSCDECYEKIMSWQAVNIHLPKEFRTPLEKWEHETPMDALKSKYKRTNIKDVEFTVSDYSKLHKAFELALSKKSEVVVFGNFIFSVKETEDYIASCEKSC